MNLRFLALIVAGCVIPRAALAAITLKPGDPAPPIKVAKWIKAPPPASATKGRLRVVDFFASWSPSSRQAIPGVNALAAKHAGKVSFVGISVHERKSGPSDRAYFGAVQAFVKSLGTQMRYPTGIDGPEGSMAKAWLRAAGETDVPVAFIVGKTGRIVWIGHSMMLEPVLHDVLSGRFDVQRFAAQRAKEKAAEEKEEKLFAKFNSLSQAGKHREAVAELDRIGQASPEHGRRMVLVRYSLLLKFDEAQAYQFGRELLDGELKEQSGLLWLMARTLLDETPGLKKPDYRLALDLSQRATDLTEGRDANILTALAFAHFKLGHVDEAIQIQEKAIPIGDANPQIPQRNKDLMRTRLAMFRKAKAGG